MRHHMVLREETLLEIIKKLLPKKLRWRVDAFELVAKSENFVSGYEIALKCKVSYATAYAFIKEMVKEGLFQHPAERPERERRVKIAELGKQIYEKTRISLFHQST